MFVLFFTAIGANMTVEAIATVGYAALGLCGGPFGVFRVAHSRGSPCRGSMRRMRSARGARFCRPQA